MQLNSALIPTVTHARDAGFLAEGVTVIPARLHLVVCLVESEALAELEEVRHAVLGPALEKDRWYFVLQLRRAPRRSHGRLARATDEGKGFL